MVLLLWKELWADSLGSGGRAQPLTTHGAQHDWLLTCPLKTSAFTPLSVCVCLCKQAHTMYIILIIRIFLYQCI